MSALSSTQTPVIVTPGDPSGIGPEITLKAALTGKTPFVAIADPEHMAKLSAELGLSLDICIWQPGQKLDKHYLSIFPHRWPAEVIAGHPDDANSASILGAIELAVTHVLAGDASALVTNPINKYVLYKAGFTYPGHTEFLASLSRHRKHPVMMLANDFLRVIPVTIHNPVSEISERLTPALLYKTAIVTQQDLTNRFGIENPRITVCGLNPHAGEQGTLGSEDITIIKPVLLQLLSEGVNVTGPLPADSLFHQSARSEYDCVLGMYHDQVLPVVKALDFMKTVNITLGLDFIRTSPDHGTAYDIAGKNKAKPDSLIAAIDYARMLSHKSVTPASIRK
jgi:4-hydroxythreonine-4-phosphate dehydrogenase